MAPLEQGLTEADFPHIYRSADAASLEGQKRHLQYTRLRLYFVIFAAAASAATAGVSQSGIQKALVALSLFFFLAASAAEIILLSTRPDESWYHGRAVAESVKTLTWKYCVCADPFPHSMGAADAERLFLQQLSDIVAESPIFLDYSSTGSQQITSTMKELRASDFSTRKIAYCHGRIEDQRSWYSRSAKKNERSALRWGVALVALELLGATGSLLILLNVTNLDMGSALAAGVAAGGAWIGVKQYDSLASAYSLTATELALVRAEADQVTDDTSWSRYVISAEQAISREHTMWLARRARVRVPRRRST
ncbi:DUF4231 domain-containing protein [Streptomyces sp. NPDC101117]|uniref:DUF4231 domain-containing protein n=1 Tax=Streptomyces sp. NPDC101117 TaxID=3366108 RepID=UPI0038189F3D